jgi:cell division septum initiation protein DivIVA
MGNIYSSHQIEEYKQKIEDLEKRVLELEQKVFLGYDSVNGMLVKRQDLNDNQGLLTLSVKNEYT